MTQKILSSETFNDFFQLIINSKDSSILLLEEVLDHFFTLLQKDLQGLYQDFKKILDILKIYEALYKQYTANDSWYHIDSLRIKFFISVINNFKTIKLHTDFIFEEEINDILDSFFLIIQAYQMNSIKVSSQNNENYNILAHIYATIFDLMFNVDLKLGLRISTIIDRIFRNLPKPVISFLQSKLQIFEKPLTRWILPCGDVQAQCAILNIVLTLCNETQRRNELIQILTKDDTIFKNLNNNKNSLRYIIDHINLMQGENRSVYTAHALRIQIDDTIFKPPSRGVSKKESLLVDFNLVLGSISVTCDSELISSLQIRDFSTKSNQIVIEISKSQINSAEIKDQIKSHGTKRLILRLNTHQLMVCKLRCELINEAHEFSLEFKKNEELDELERWVFPKLFGPTGRKSSVCMIDPTPVRRSHVASQIFNSKPTMLYKSEMVQPSSLPTSSFESKTPLPTSSSQEIPKKQKILYSQMEPEIKTSTDSLKDNLDINSHKSPLQKITQMYLHSDNIILPGNNLASQETVKALPISPQLKSHLNSHSLKVDNSISNANFSEKSNNEVNEDSSKNAIPLSTCKEENETNLSKEQVDKNLSKTEEINNNDEKQIVIEPKTLETDNHSKNKYEHKSKGCGKEEIAESSEDEIFLISYVGKDLLEDKPNNNEKVVENFEEKIPNLDILKQEISSNVENSNSDNGKQISPTPVKGDTNTNKNHAEEIISEWDSDNEKNISQIPNGNKNYKENNLNSVSRFPGKNIPSTTEEVPGRRSRNRKLYTPSKDFMEETLEKNLDENPKLNEQNIPQINQEIQAMVIEKQKFETSTPHNSIFNDGRNEQESPVLFSSLKDVKKYKQHLKVTTLKKKNLKKKRKNDVYDINFYSTSDKEFSPEFLKPCPWLIHFKRKQISKKKNNCHHRKNSELLFDQMIGDKSGTPPNLKPMLPAPKLRSKTTDSEANISHDHACSVEKNTPLNSPDKSNKISHPNTNSENSPEKSYNPTISKQTDSDSDGKFVSCTKRFRKNKNDTKSRKRIKKSKKFSERTSEGDIPSVVTVDESSNKIGNSKIHANITTRDLHKNISNNNDDIINISHPEENLIEEENSKYKDQNRRNKKYATLLVSKNKNKNVNEVLSNSLVNKKRKIDSTFEMTHSMSTGRNSAEEDQHLEDSNISHRFYEASILKETLTKMYSKPKDRYYETPKVNRTQLHQDKSFEQKKIRDSRRYFEAQMITEPVPNTSNSDSRFYEKFVLDTPRKKSSKMEETIQNDDHKLSPNNEEKNLETSNMSDMSMLKKFKDSFEKHNKCLQKKKLEYEKNEEKNVTIDSDSESCSSGFTSRFSNKSKRNSKSEDSSQKPEKLNHSEISVGMKNKSFNSHSKEKLSKPKCLPSSEKGPTKKFSFSHKQKNVDIGAGGDASLVNKERSVFEFISTRGDGDYNRFSTFQFTLDFIQENLKSLFSEHLTQITAITISNLKKNENIQQRMEQLNKIKDENHQLIKEMNFEFIKFKKKFESIFEANKLKFKDNLHRAFEEILKIIEVLKQLEDSKISKLEKNLKKQVNALIESAGDKHEKCLFDQVKYFLENYNK